MKNIFLLLVLVFFSCANAFQDPLPSWSEGKIKHAIIEFVQAVSNEKSKEYVPPEDRFATIDNDGTLWVEQPMYTQMVFMNERFHEIAGKQPTQYKSPGDWLGNKEDIEDLYAVTSTAISVDDYKNIVKQWLASAVHPRYQRHYTELVYQPMLEVMNYLRKNNFQVYIVSGSGQDFIRSYAEDAYGVKPNFVIGSTSKTDYIYQGKKPTLIKIPKLLFIDDKEGKPQAINLFIGKKPLIAFGNSDGDRQMLEWTQSGAGKRLMFLVRHDDANREYAYDVNSKIGHLSRALMQEAKENNWHIISMKKEWQVIFPFESKLKKAF
jgi:phosphoglycolate phosphatase-like HAD superfamily hydrolase